MITAGLALAGLATLSSASADEVTHWNEVALQTEFAVAAGIRTTTASRALAMVHVAVFDAVNAIDRRFTPYPLQDATGNDLFPDDALFPDASPEAATVAAAHAVLVALYPIRQASLDSEYAASIASIPDGSAKTQGISLGESLAAAVLASRASDGSGPALTAPYTACPPLPQPCPVGIYQPAPLEGMPAGNVGWGMVTPFALTTGAQFRAEGPPALSSSEYAADYDEVKSIGALASNTRTADQTEAALFWRENIQIPWNRIAQQVALFMNGSLLDRARLFALLDIAGADTSIASFDTKYTYDFWRPREAIRAGDGDGNDQTIGDPTWTPLGYIAVHPDYDSQHAAWGAAAASVLADVLGSDAFGFTLTTSTAPNGVSRSYGSFSQAAVENMNSRVWLGAHFRTACHHGFNQGRQVAQYVLGHVLKPLKL
jgi:PAP2 superfamily